MVPPKIGQPVQYFDRLGDTPHPALVEATQDDYADLVVWRKEYGQGWATYLRIIRGDLGIAPKSAYWLPL